MKRTGGLATAATAESFSEEHFASLGGREGGEEMKSTEKATSGKGTNARLRRIVSVELNEYRGPERSNG